IAAEHVTHIFEEYYQGQEGADHGGVGLGLAIVQRLGKLLGHHVDVRSAPGKGSASLSKSHWRIRAQLSRFNPRRYRTPLMHH
ncbi:MAG: ATP-binding protein, partial [Pseudolabrys sp.]